MNLGCHHSRGGTKTDSTDHGADLVALTRGRTFQPYARAYLDYGDRRVYWRPELEALLEQASGELQVGPAKQ